MKKLTIKLTNSEKVHHICGTFPEDKSYTVTDHGLLVYKAHETNAYYPWKYISVVHIEKLEEV